MHTLKLFTLKLLKMLRHVDDDRMNEICRNISKSFNVNNLSVCIGWCADQVTTCLYLLSVLLQQHPFLYDLHCS